MSTFSERLRQAFNSADISQEELGKAAGVSQQSIAHLMKKGKGSTRTNSIAKALNVNPEWLITGSGEMRPNATKSTEFQIRDNQGQYNISKVPLIASVQAGSFCESNDIYLPGAADEYVACPVSHSDKTYALRIEGESMKPRFHPGEIIIIDPERAATSGSFVVAKREGDQKVTFKQLIEDGDRHYLKALNPDWPTPIMELTEDWRTCGVLICKVELF